MKYLHYIIRTERGPHTDTQGYTFPLILLVTLEVSFYSSHCALLFCECRCACACGDVGKTLFLLIFSSSFHPVFIALFVLFAVTFLLSGDRTGECSDSFFAFFLCIFHSRHAGISVPKCLQISNSRSEGARKN